MGTRVDTNQTFRQYIIQKFETYTKIEELKRTIKIDEFRSEKANIIKTLSEKSDIELKLSLEKFDELLNEYKVTIWGCFKKLRNYEDKNDENLQLVSDFCEIFATKVEILIYKFLDSDINGKFIDKIANTTPGSVQVYNLLKGIGVFDGDNLLYRGWLECRKWLPKAYVMIFNKKSNFIALESKKKKGIFTLPGGRMEMCDKSSKETVLREIMEELEITNSQQKFYEEIDKDLSEKHSFIMGDMENEKVYSTIFVIVSKHTGDIKYNEKVEEHCGIELIHIDDMSSKLLGGNEFEVFKTQICDILNEIQGNTRSRVSKKQVGKRKSKAH